MNVNHDCQFNVAVGKSRLDKVWHNEKTTWSAFLDRLTHFTCTGETAETYQNMTKAQKGIVKDIGGFVGAYLKDGIRQKAHVVEKTLITLDMDNAPKDYKERIEKILSCLAHAVYSTHSHTSEKPRLRIVIPMTKPISPDAYMAVARRIAADIDIDFFDQTTFAPERLMFWPSCPRGVEPVSYSVDAPILDPDDVLASYEDWHDASTWPMAAAEKQVPEKFMARAAGKDPRDKPGWVGAFCRTYTVPQAIETFLSGIYVPFKKRTDRYTYVNGSSAGGLHVFGNGLLAYSFHATDPTSQMACNAFDLVRIHLFGDMDADFTQPGHKSKSYDAMVERCCMNNSAVKLEMLRSREGPPVEPVKDTDFDDSLLDAEHPDKPKEEKPDDLMGKLEVTKSGQIKKTVKNLQIIIRNDKNLKGCIAYDLFAGRLVKTRQMVWDKNPPLSNAWSDTDDACIRNYMDVTYQLQCRAILDDVLLQEAHMHEFHPVRDWLKSLPPWDGIKRVERLFVDYLGAEDTEYSHTLARLMCRAAIARVFHPGCKFDYVLVISGGQGIGKSTLLRKLAGKWFSDSLTSFDGKDAVEQLQGRWIIEVGEMQAASKAESGSMKAFISRQADKVRLPYQHRSTEFPRQCILVGTSNDRSFLKDFTGNRRFWVLDAAPGNMAKTPKDAFDITDDEVKQIWAEAMEDYKKHYHTEADLCLPQKLKRMALDMQETHMDGLEVKDQIEGFLELPIPTIWEKWDISTKRQWVQDHIGDDLPLGEYSDSMYDVGSKLILVKRTRVCVLEIACELFGKDRNMVQSYERKNIMNLMSQVQGWHWDGNRSSVRRVKGYGMQRCFIKDDKNEYSLLE